MIFPQGLVLLDTNVLIHLIRGNSLGRWVESCLGSETFSEDPLISTITLGEILAIARRRAWGPNRIGRLEELVSELFVVDIGSAHVLSRYAEVDYALGRMGKPIQQNDMWIAATAIASGAHLLTADKDFDPLHPHYLQRTWIDPLSFQS